MLRNHVIDPENKPPPINTTSEKGVGYQYGNEDPWYSSAPAPESPINNNYAYSNFNALQKPVEAQRYDQAYDTDDYSNEPPLLDELGIRFDHIWSKTQAVLIPNKVKILLYLYL